MSQYSTYYMQSQGERFSLVEAGVSEKVLAKTARDMGFDEDKLRAILRLRRSHRSTKGTSANGVFRADEASRVVALLRLIGQVETMVAEAGNPEHFDAARWLAKWMKNPNQALGGKCPAEYMHLTAGLELLSALLAQFQSGAYA